MNILDYIPTGKENAISRESLVNLTGADDRTIRDAIHQARRETPIINLSDGSGYYIPDMESDTDIADLQAYVTQEENRLRSIGWALKAARKTLRKAEA